jgi:hypothetical protein
VQQQQVKARPPSVRSLNSAVSARVARIIQLALAKEPRNRIQGCERFRGMLAGEIEPPFPWKRVLQGAAAVLLCAGIYVAAAHWSQLMPPTPTPPRPDTELTSETTMEASRNFELLCRESAQELKLEKGKKIAEQVPDTASVEKFDREIGESKQKIADFAEQYNLNVRRLATIDEPTVARALDDAATDSSRAPFIDAIKSQMKQIRATPRDIAVSELLQFCGSLPGDSP